MSEPVYQYWIGIKLTLKLISAPASTKTVWLTRRPKTSQAGTDAIYWPIITDISELGYGSGQWLPETSTGTISLDNRPGSFGPGRKFSDLLERYAIINQPIEVYVDTTAGGDDAFSFAAGDLQWAGHVEAWNGVDTINLSVSSNEIPDHVACMQIDATNFPTATDDCLGKYLPIAVGLDVLIPTFPWSVADDTNGTWAAAANLGMDYIHTIPGLYTPYNHFLDHRGNWHVEAGGFTAQGSISSVDGSYSLDRYASQASAISMGGTCAPYFGFKVALKPNDAGAPFTDLTGTIMTATVYEYDPAQHSIGDAVVSGTVDLGNYNTENRAGLTTYFWATVLFDQIFVPSYTLYYAVAFSVSNWKTETPDLCYDTGVAQDYFYQSNDPTLDSNEFQLGASSFTFILDWLPLNLGVATGRVTDGEGFTPFEFQSVGSAPYPVDGGKSLEWVCSTNGIVDDASGTITGLALTPLTRPDWFIELLDRMTTGSPWAASGKWDFTTGRTRCDVAYDTSGMRTRQLKGYLSGYVTVTDIVEAVCKDTATKIGIYNNGKLFPWPWGVTGTVAQHIPPDDIIPQDWAVSDPTSIINRVSVNYGKSQVEYSGLTNTSGQSSKNFSGTLLWNSAANSKSALLAGDSLTLYGQRPIAEVETDFIGDETSAETLAEYYLATYAHPQTYAEFTVPFSYSARQMFDVITFGHMDFPSFYGTNPETPQPPQVGASAAASNLSEGRPFYNYKQYRGIIEGRYLQLPTDGAPSFRFRVRVLNNYPADPT